MDVRMKVIALWGYVVAALVSVGGMALVPACCRGADSASALAGADWKKEIEADWLRQLTTRLPLIEVHAANGCDGKKDGTWCHFATEKQENPWWQVDLGARCRLGRIVVYNTKDLPQDAKNLRILLSDDGEKWQEVYRHDGTVFGGAVDRKPLVVKLDGPPACLVRAALPSGSLHLDEIEVYGTEGPERNLALGQPATMSSRGR